MVGLIAPFTLRPIAALAATGTYSAVSTRQYSLTNNDGSTWQDLDPTNLIVTFKAPVTTQATVTASADMFTSTAGYSQDLAIYVGPAGTVAAWKEGSGASSYAPSPVSPKAVISVTAGTTYTVKLQWRSNTAMPSGPTIYAGAGGSAPYSPTSLIVQLSASGASYSASKNQLYTLYNSDGSTWQEMDPTNLSLTITPTADTTALLNATADLYTDTAGYNQDLGINVASGSGSSVVAWKESGGAAVYQARSPLVQAVVQMTANTTYTIRVRWKSNRSMNGPGIYAGAGTVQTGRSPTTLSAQLISGPSTIVSKASTTQYSLSNSDGNTWQNVDPTNLGLTLTPTTNCQGVVSGSADLYSSGTGYNQDLGISVQAGVGPINTVAWKESAESAALSPSATYVQALVQLTAQTTYTIRLQWKTNTSMSGGPLIYAGAGSSAPYSPTSLIAQLSTCVGAAAPGTPTATSGNASASLSWSAPSDGSPVDHYVITPFKTGVAQAAVPTPDPNTSFTVTGLACASYTFTVAAQNTAGVGLASLQSNAIVPLGCPPTAPTAVTATSASNSAVVRWVSPTFAGSGPVTDYVVTATINGQVQPSLDTHSAGTSYNYAGLSPAQSDSFTVTGAGVGGQGPASAPSSAVTPAEASATGLGRSLLWTAQVNGVECGSRGFVSAPTSPALAAWTVEMVLWNYQGNLAFVTSGFGALTGAHSIAGIDADRGQPQFSYPNGTGSYTHGSNVAVSTSTPQYLVIEYDGSSTIRDYVQGQLKDTFTGIGNAAIPANQAFGFLDTDATKQFQWDEMRISNASLYTASNPPTSMPTSRLPNVAGQTVALYHFDDFQDGFLWQGALGQDHSTPLFPGGITAFKDYSGNGRPLATSVSPYNVAGQCAQGIGRAYSLSPGMTPDQLAGGGAPWSCPFCHLSGDPINTATGEFSHAYTDISIPGRGVPISFSHTYSSVRSTLLGPLGYGWDDSYDVRLDSASGKVYGGNGSITQFVNQGGGVWQSPPGTFATLSGSGPYILTDKTNMKYNFDSNGRLVSEVDPSGLYTTSLSYNGGGQLTTITDPAGRPLSLVYYPSTNLVNTVTDNAGRTVSLSYTANQLTQVQDIGGGITTFGYTTSNGVPNLLQWWREPNCNAIPSQCSQYTAQFADGSFTGVANVYDTATPPRVIRQYDNLGYLTQYNYQTTGIPTDTVVTDANGHQVFDEYLNNGLTKQIRGYNTPLASTTTFTGDSTTFKPSSSTDGDNHSTVITYDPIGNPLTSTDAAGNTTTRTWDAKFGTMLSEADPRQDATTTYTIDSGGSTPTGKLLSITRPLAGSSPAVTREVDYAYTAPQPLDITQKTVKEIAPDSQFVWNYSYDANGDLASVQDPSTMAGTTKYCYDSVGRVTSRIAPKGSELCGDVSNSYRTLYQTNAFGDLTQITDPLGRLTQTGFDGDRNQTSVLDANQHTTVFTYDANDRLTKTTRPDTTYLQTGYDPVGNLTSQVDAGTNTWQYDYDALNRQDWSQDPNLKKTSYAYDGGGLMTSSKDPDLLVTSSTYDADGRLMLKQYPTAATPPVSYTYDADGQRATMADGTGITSYTFDSLHRLTSTSGAQTVTYGYNLRGQVTSMTYPGNHTVNRHFDGAGRLDWVQDWVNSTKDTFTYDADGNLTTEALPNRVNTTYGPYDQADQLGDSIAHGSAPANITATKLTTSIMNISYTQRDGLGQLQSETNVLNATTSSYLYDNVDRLTGVNGATAYGYDPANTVNQTPSNHTLRYDSADQLCWTLPSASANSCAAAPTGATIYGYDHRGNRTSQAPTNGPSLSLAYDDENRLLTLLSGQTSASYTYNGDGLRTTRTVNASTTQQTWDVAEGLPLLLQDSSTFYVYGPGGAPVEQISSGGSVKYYHTDKLGSVRAASDQSGAQVATYDYDPYGNLSSSTGSISNPLRYAGQYYDSESGLYYMQARYYDPATGQFISRDPIVAQTLQPYGYVAENPLNSVDPSGLDAQYLDTHAHDQILLAKGGNQNQRDTGLKNLDDKEISRRARDKKLSPQERRRYQKEEKGRDLRHRGPTVNNSSPFILDPVIPFLNSVESTCGQVLEEVNGVVDEVAPVVMEY